MSKNAIDDLERRVSLLIAQVADLYDYINTEVLPRVNAVIAEGQAVSNEMEALINERDGLKHETSGDLKSPAGPFADQVDERSTLVSGHFEGGRK